jgi:hypothetical protein
VREQGDEIWDGEARDSPYPLGVFPPSMALDWEVDSAEDEDSSLAILDAFEKDFLQEVKVAHPKSKGRREILNLVSSINYGDASASTRHRKGKAHVRLGGMLLEGLLGSFFLFCGLLWLFLCIFPVFLGVPYAFLIKLYFL